MDDNDDEVSRELGRRILGADTPRAARLRETLAAWQGLRRVQRGGGTPAEAREAAGLKPGQASRVTGIPRERLAAIEAGAPMSDAERATLMGAYDCDGFAPAGESPGAADRPATEPTEE